MKERMERKKTYLIWLSIVVIIFSLVFPQWLVFSASASGDSYYVSTSGSDSNAGTLASPWRTIQKAANTVTQGDTVYIRGGTYNEKVTISKAGNGAWITFQPYNNENVIVDGTGITSDVESGVIQLDGGSNFIHITGLEIKNAGYAGVAIKSSSTDTTDIKIDHCIIHECAASGIWAHSNGYGSGKYIRRLEFSYNTVYSVHNSFDGQEAFSFSGVLGFEIHHNSLSDYGREGIDCKSGSSSGSIHHNVIDTSRASSKFRSDWNHIGIYIDGYSRTNHDIDVYCNYITGYAGTGINLNAEQGGSIENINVYNNVVSLRHKSGYSSFRCLDELNDCSWTNIKIYSNTFYIDSGAPSRIRSSEINNLVIANNIFSSASEDLLEISSYSYPNSEITLTNNLYYSVSGNAHASWSNGDHDGTNPINADPKFVSTSDFHLQSSSPAKDEGDIDTAASSDFDGIYRPQGITIDIGAYEYHVTTSDTTPPLLSNIQLQSSTILDVDIGWENITCTATDNIAIHEVVLTLTNSNKITTTLQMHHKSDTSTYYYNISLKQSGNYTYYVWADDTSNNRVSSNNMIFPLPANWDINNDGRCTILDKVFISLHYGQTGTPGWIREDVDNNGKINLLDFTYG
jgi:Pel9A-like, right handed beta helix region